MGSGTGFFIEDGSLVATAGHNYWEANKAIAEEGKGGALYAHRSDDQGHFFLVKLEFIKADEVHDLAVFRFDKKSAGQQWWGFTPRPLQLAHAQPCAGDEICCIGYFGIDQFPIALRGIIGALTRGSARGEEILMDVSLNPGQSGGPVVDWQTGEVVGIATSYVPITLSSGGPAVHSGISRATEVRHLESLVDSLLP